MDLDLFPAVELPTVFRTLRTALAPSGPLSPPERSFLATCARIVGCPPLRDEPTPIAPVDIAIASPRARLRLVQLAVLAALLARPVKPESVAYVEQLAATLHVDEPAIETLRLLAAGHRRRVRLSVMRRVMGNTLAEARASEGTAGIVRMFAALFFRIPVNLAQRWRYRELGLLPEGTLGREYWKHMTARRFAFPGDLAGIPGTVAYHDVGHVLTGHDTTPRDEICQAAFQAGNRRRDGFSFALFGVVHFHQGVKVTPAAPADVAHFDPARVLWAIHRGARCTVDMTHAWDFWPLMAMPLPEARRRCGLMPA